MKKLRSKKQQKKEKTTSSNRSMEGAESNSTGNGTSFTTKTRKKEGEKATKRSPMPHEVSVGKVYLAEERKGGT